MFLLAQLCGPQDASWTASSGIGEPTAVGQAAVQFVASAVLQAPEPNERQLARALAASTISNVLTARHMCLVALQASLSAANCFTLFQFAERASIAPLLRAAEQLCLASMPRGGETAADEQGFCGLLPEQVQHLLQSDELQVSSELDVFHALTAWVRGRPKERAPLLGELVRRCVRLGCMDLRQLEALDQEPAVVASGEVTRVVAQAYVMRIMGVRGSEAAAAGKEEAAASTSVRPSVARAVAATAMAMADEGYGEEMVGEVEVVGEEMAWEAVF